MITLLPLVEQHTLGLSANGRGRPSMPGGASSELIEISGTRIRITISNVKCKAVKPKRRTRAGAVLRVETYESTVM